MLKFLQISLILEEQILKNVDEGFYLALATHSIVTSDVPVTTLVFLGGMMIVGAMGSAGPPISRWTNKDTQKLHTNTLMLSKKLID